MHQDKGTSGAEFFSAYDAYTARLRRKYDPIVVASGDEWVSQLEDLSFDNSLVVKTLILPKGVHLSDPRLKKAKVKGVKQYSLPAGQFFEHPDLMTIADISPSLVPPAAGPFANKETRYQILGASRIEDSVQAAQESRHASMYPCVEEGYEGKPTQGRNFMDTLRGLLKA